MNKIIANQLVITFYLGDFDEKSLFFAKFALFYSYPQNSLEKISLFFILLRKIIHAPTPILCLRWAIFWRGNLCIKRRWCINNGKAKIPHPQKTQGATVPIRVEMGGSGLNL